MATRQTSGKPAKVGQAKAGQARAGQAKTGQARAGQAKSGQANSGAAKPAATAPPPRGRLSAAWHGAVRGWHGAVSWSGGGVPFATFVVSILGLADSIYLTYQHFTQATSFVGCSDSGTVNCLKVTTSAWSWLPAGGPPGFGIPVSVAGLAFFVFMVLINSRWGWRAPWPLLHWVRLVSVIVGMVLVLYLVWAELFRINAICLFCTGVHILTFILFALIVGKATFSGVKPMPDSR
jgi:uncharacterized membrane protein